jgi:3-hydroxyacyl-CoA dehydrogenase
MKDKLVEKWKFFHQGVNEASQRLDQASNAVRQCEKQLDQNLGARAGIENVLVDEYGKDIMEEIQKQLKEEAQEQQQQVEEPVVDLTDEPDDDAPDEVTDVEAEEIKL